MTSFMIILASVLAGLDDRPDLAGRVVDPDGNPVAGAHVFIATAAPKKGAGVLCPSCYPDCAKQTDTGPDGSFRIDDLDRSLTFQVLAVADGLRPAFAQKVDPSAGPLELKLETPASVEPLKQVWGRVIDPEGRPVAGATVEPKMMDTEAFRGFSPDVFEPVAVTDLDGKFTLRANSKIRSVDVQVEGRGLAPRIFRELKPGLERTITLTPGARVTGRLIQQGKPVAGAVMGLCQASKNSDTYLGDEQVATDESGTFRFENVASGDAYFVYALMGGLPDSGALIAREIQVGEDGSESDIGELAAEPGHRVTGRLVLSDGKPVPPGTRVLISREDAWDTLTTQTTEGGSFSFEGLPSERYSLHVSVPGYHLSPRNATVDAQNPYRLVGYVDEDITGLTVLLVPRP